MGVSSVLHWALERERLPRLLRTQRKEAELALRQRTLCSCGLLCGAQAAATAGILLSSPAAVPRLLTGLTPPQRGCLYSVGTRMSNIKCMKALARE